ncbi:hypothetical protein FQN51_002265 [Onygenales sp. PD_10]|nr:hypothetical protein FQN51_002265 [Onygenales sp. PD_10]
MATPSSKNNPGQTPNHLTSSPHPSAVPMGRPLSHKSPSIRTPSASGHGHHPSVSSHQYPTPMAAPTTMEENATFSSPSALLALGLGGITPSPAGNDGLAGPGMNEAGMASMGMSTLGMGGPRDTDEEKARRMAEVIRLLRTRVAGRGVCREGVERLGKFEGFECMWQDNNLTIAGNLVDLEIEFEGGTENVKDVSLKYSTPDAPEGERRVEATAVLRRDLIQSTEDCEQITWKTLDAFHANLHRLSKLDQLSQDVNCFEAVEGLYENLKRVWDGEIHRAPDRGHREHVCTSLVGEPSLHQGKRIGLTLDYWVEQRRLLDSKEKSRQDAMNVDQPLEDGSRPSPAEKSKTWSTIIECEEGYPSLRVSKEWVSSDMFTAVDTGEPSSTTNENDSEILLINWLDPPTTIINNSNDISLDSSTLPTSTPNRRFVARLEPPVDLPIIAAAEVYRILELNMPPEQKTVTYDGLVVPLPAAEDELLENGSLLPNRRTQEKPMYAFDDEGRPRKYQHTYTFHPFEHIVGRTIRDLPFSHPRQLADILPILRQYALLSSLLQRTFTAPGKDGGTIDKSQTSKDANTSPPKQTTKSGVTYISNISPTVSKLNSMLSEGPRIGNGHRGGVSSPHSGLSPPISSLEDRKIDISLRTPMSASPSIILLFNVPEEKPDGCTANNPKTITINVDIGPNGSITVSHVSGLPNPDTTDISAEMLGDAPMAESKGFNQKLAKVLQTSEDLGLLVEWVLKWIRKQKA